MKVCVLASGSKGNCTYIETKQTKSLIDLGMSNLYVENSLIALNINPDTIQNIFITHTHVDHVAGLKVFLKKHHPTVFLSQKMYDELSLSMVLTNYVILEDTIYIDDLTVEFFKTSHDTDSVGYIFKSGDKEIVYVTDTGYINRKNYALLKNKTMYIIESNHDVELLMDNPHYPYQTKQRILSDNGHLSNVQCSSYLTNFVGNKTSHIVLAHLSEQNNRPEIALTNVKDKLEENDISIKHILVASQKEKSELIEV